MRTVGGLQRAESIDDVERWVRDLPGCPAVSRTWVVTCPAAVHDAADPATWFYVEADAGAGVARTRCVGCGHVEHVLDSEQRWTYPPAWACLNCNQSIAEVVHGVHEGTEGAADWHVLAARCVECGAFAGLTDAFAPA